MSADLRSPLSPNGRKAVVAFALLVHAFATGDTSLLVRSLMRLRRLGWFPRRRTPRTEGDAVAVFLDLVRADEARTLSAFKNILVRLKKLGWSIIQIQPQTGRRRFRAY
jgi:hypothetical protein